MSRGIECGADIFFLFVAIQHVFRYVEQFKDLSDEERLEAAEQRFLQETPHSKDVRDFLEHLARVCDRRGSNAHERTA